MARDPQLSASVQNAIGLPATFQRASPFPFAGINQTDARLALQDPEFYWCENLIRIGNGALRSQWDIGPAFYTAPAGKTIVSFFWYNIGATNYVAVFLSDGTAIQVRYADAAQTTISSTANTFYNSATGQLPACCGSGGLYLLIANNNTANDYWIWDGTILYSAGSVGPVVTITDAGNGYTSVPTVTPYGGSGTGLTAGAVITNGSVTSVYITNPGTGYEPSDIVQFGFTGGGSDNGAVITAQIGGPGLSDIIVTAGGSGYTGVPAVAITGGGGSGAAAVAVVTGGVVTAINVTAPGTGYTGNPTIGITGGSGSGAAAEAQLTVNTVTGFTIVDGGTNFTSTPLLTITGGEGTGATATATVTAGVITAVTLTNAGSGYTTSPAVMVSGGLNNAAQAQATLMPFGVSGTYIETYQSRVWLDHPFKAPSAQPTGGVINVSAPESITDFATSDGGDVFTSSDRFLRYQFTGMRQSNGYLYTLGDSSVSVISNVQTSGNPPDTTFNYQNADPQTGSAWPATLADFGRTILFANQLGVFGVYGGSVVKISAKLDRIFQNMIIPGNAAGTPCVTPSAATAVLFNIKVYVLLLTITDPFTNAPRTVQVLWDEKNWYVASSAAALTFIGGFEMNSGLSAWGTDGTSLYPMFNAPSSTLPKYFVTKYWGVERIETIKEAQRWYVVGQDVSVGQAGIALYWNTDYAAADPQTGFNGQGTFLSPNNADGPVVLGGSNVGMAMAYGLTDGVSAPLLGFKVSTTSPDFVLNHAAMGYLSAIAAIYG